ncbi:MAG: primosomal protein N' [Pyrinomonadaceae bacterium]|nr:primosomal protein N' [Pyrinomonadaceae bacterium]
MSSTKQPKFVEAALPVPLRRVFTYRIPTNLQGRIVVGARLKLPFGKRNLTGYAVALHDAMPAEADFDESKLKDVLEVVDEEPLITPEILKLTQWTADYYASFWGEMLKAALPAGLHAERVRPKRRKAVRLLTDLPEDSDKALTEQQEFILEMLASNGGTMLWTEILEQADVGASPLNTLARRGCIEVYVEDVRRDPLDRAEFPAVEKLDLTSDQQTALDGIVPALKEREYHAFLLHGVTGSGKTEVYIRAMRSALDEGLSALMLVPEISLTPIFSRRLRSVFGSKVAILHSSLAAGERYDEWRRIRLGQARIAIGTRSAVFAPLENLGLVIVDEEHDASYRQHESPFYHARDVAVMRAHSARAVVVLGSATPAMESFHNAKSGKYTYLQLPDRIAGRSLADAQLVDMREVFKRAGKDVALSPELLDAVAATHARGEQSIVMLNRRGFSQFVLCRSCGETIKCKNCDITLTFHRRDGKLLCHYCNYRIATPRICPKCESEYLYFIGEGTENLAEQFVKRFPAMRIARVDRDTMTHKGELDQVLLDFAAGGLDMLVGTQMIAKGHDFPNVTLVGVVGIDIGLGMPDLRSAERTFQLITQVAGRSGRGDKPGTVLIQTYYPDHYALRHAMRQDYEGFYAEEIRFRERLAYPPFVVLASIMIKHRDHAKAMRNATILRRALDAAVKQFPSMQRTASPLDVRKSSAFPSGAEKNPGGSAADPRRSLEESLENQPAKPSFAANRQAEPERQASSLVRILGPAPASLSRLKNEYRIQIILKSQSRRSLRETLDIALAYAGSCGCEMRTIFVEIDPVNLM